MKRLLALILISSALFSFSACGGEKSTDAASAGETKAAQEEVAGEEEKTDDKETADDETKADADEAKEVYWATDDKDPSDVSYHTKDCTIIKDKSPDVLSWEIINTLGMPACEKCNP